MSETVEVRRETLEVLVETLSDMPWMRAAEALQEIRMALLEDPTPPEPPTFGNP